MGGHCLPGRIPNGLPKPSFPVLHSFLLGFTFNNLQFSGDLSYYQAVTAVPPGDLANVGSLVRDLQVQDVERHVPWCILQDTDPAPVVRQENMVARVIPPKDGDRTLVTDHHPLEYFLYEVLHRHIDTWQGGRILPYTLNLRVASQVQKSCRKNGEETFEEKTQSM